MGNHGSSSREKTNIFSEKAKKIFEKTKIFSEKIKIFSEKAKIFSEKTKQYCLITGKTVYTVGREDPKKLIHAFKVGLALTGASMLYLVTPVYKQIGDNTTWAVMTVVVVFESTAGATLCKGLNRGFGTLSAGVLAFVMGYIARKESHTVQAIFVGSMVLFIGTAATYARVIPHVKKNYDYGVLVFLLTFNLIAASTYRVENVVKTGLDRIFTIGIGCCIGLLVCVLAFPNWSGEELQNSILTKLEGLAKATQTCVVEYFKEDKDEATHKSLMDQIYESCKAVLDSKDKEEALALYASWEPRRCFPWNQYANIGSALRDFGFSIMALHECLRSEVQTPSVVRTECRVPCIRLAFEVAIALTDFAESLENRRLFCRERLSDRVQVAVQVLNDALKTQRTLDFSEALPFAAFTYHLLEAAARLERVTAEVEKLGTLAGFEKFHTEVNTGEIC